MYQNARGKASPLIVIWWPAQEDLTSLKDGDRRRVRVRWPVRWPAASSHGHQKPPTVSAPTLAHTPAPIDWFANPDRSTLKRHESSKSDDDDSSGEEALLSRGHPETRRPQRLRERIAVWLAEHLVIPDQASFSQLDVASAERPFQLVPGTAIISRRKGRTRLRAGETRSRRSPAPGSLRGGAPRERSRCRCPREPRRGPPRGDDGRPALSANLLTES
jgi:hypothetical protein